VAVDLHRRRERDECDVDAVPVEKLETPGEVVFAEVDGKRSFDGELEDAVPEARRRRPAGECRQERLGPKVLVDVDCEQEA
jgi:hypothetical protein